MGGALPLLVIVSASNIWWRVRQTRVVWDRAQNGVLEEQRATTQGLGDRNRPIECVDLT